MNVKKPWLRRKHCIFFLKRHIDQKVKLPITNEWKAAIKFVVDVADGEITVKPGEVFSLN